MGLVSNWGGMLTFITGDLARWLNGGVMTSGGHPIIAIGPILLLPPLVTLTVGVVHKIMSRV